MDERILIVEDEKIISEDIHRILTNYKYYVIGSVETGKEAIEKAEVSKPDMVIMDIRLAGEISGTQAAETINRKFGIPIIFLTAFSDDENIDDAKLSHPFAYLLKPVRERELLAALRIAFYKIELEKGHISDLPSVHRKQKIAQKRLNKGKGIISRILDKFL